jgi:hypothetical protein
MQLSLQQTPSSFKTIATLFADIHSDGDPQRGILVRLLFSRDPSQLVAGRFVDGGPLLVVRFKRMQDHSFVQCLNVASKFIPNHEHLVKKGN